MYKKLKLTSSLIVGLFAAWSAAAVNWDWAGTTSTDWFTSANWTKNATTNLWPAYGDAPRLAIKAGVFPAQWPHYNGNNTNSGMLPDTGVLNIAGVTNAWFYMEGGQYLHNSWVNVGSAAQWCGHWIQTNGTFDNYTYQRNFDVGPGAGNSPNGDLTVSGGLLKINDFGIGRNNGHTTAGTNCWALFTDNAQVYAKVMFLGMACTNAMVTNRANASLTVEDRIEIGGLKPTAYDGLVGGTGRFYQEGGTVTASHLSLSNTLSTTYVLSGGTLSLNYMDETGAGTFVFDGGTLAARGGSERLIRPIGAVTINAGKTAYITNAGLERIMANMSGDGGLTKLGGGTLVLERTNTYTGSTLVSTGMVIFGADQFLNNVTVNPNAGIGTDIDLSDNRARLATLTMGAGSTFNFTLDAGDLDPVPARMVLTNGLVLNGPVTLNLVPGTEVLSSNSVYNLLDYGSVGISGSGSITLGPLPCGMMANLVTDGTVIGLYVTRGADKPVIAAPPASQTVGQNQPASMSITVTECADFVGYQWVQNGTNVISGATNATYSLTFAQLADAGSYTVVVTNIMGAVTSTPPAVLTVIADTTAPKPLSAYRPNTPRTTVRLVFDELLDQTSAQVPGNYDLTNLTDTVSLGAPSSATLSTDLKTVSLVFSSSLADNIRYAVTVAGVKDLALNTQTGVSVPVTLLGVLQPFGANRLIVMEAEDADIFTPTSYWDSTMRNWDITGDRPGYSGWAAVQCLPNTGFSGAPTYQGPLASYNVSFPSTDTYPITYYLWVRGAGTNSGDDSCNATLDWNYGVAPMVNNIAQNMYQPNSSGWGWTGRSDDHGLPRATLTVSSAGAHTVDLLMREDGFYCDKLVLTTDSTYDPSALNGGLGPDNVTRAIFPPTIAFIPGTVVYSGSACAMAVQTATGFTNIVEYKDSLAPGSWTELTNFVGDGSVLQVQDSSPAATGRFYRARVVIP